MNDKFTYITFKLEFSHLYYGTYMNWASLVAQLAKNPPAMQDTLVQFLSQEVSLEKATTPVFLDFPGG